MWPLRSLTGSQCKQEDRGSGGELREWWKDSYADVALMLQAISGPSERSPIGQPATGRDFVAAVDAGVSSNLRVAYCADLAGIGIDPAIESVCRTAALGLRQQGIEVEEISLDLSAGRPAFLALRGLWFVTHMRSRLGEMARFGQNVANNIRAGLEVTTTDLAAAEDTRGRIWHQFRELFTRFDHLLTPSVAVPPFPVEQNYPDTIAGRPMQTYIDWIAPTFVLSLTGLPVASVPCGLDPTGLPVGLQIVGRQHGDGAVLALAAEVQRHHPIGRPGCLR